MSTYTESRPDRELTSFQCAFTKTVFGEMKGCRAWSDVGLKPGLVLLRDIRKYGDGDVAIELYTFTPLGGTSMLLRQNMDEQA